MSVALKNSVEHLTSHLNNVMFITEAIPAIKKT